MSLPPRAKIGSYEIISALGAGGMGEVYRARDLSLGRDVALKVLPKGFAADSERLRRFEQEARAAAALNHPNIVAIYGFGTDGDHAPYLTTELLEGQTLRDRLMQGEIPVRKAIDVGLQTALGLAAAHDRGILHRDLKPENVFLTRDGVVKILDFGLAKVVAPDPKASDHGATITSTEPGLVVGTVGYMSPEQVRGQAADFRSDIFSLGAILYELLSGKRAFRGPTPADTMSAILKEEPVELSGSGRSLPPGLGRIVHRCLEKNAGERFQSARDLAFNLEMLSRDESGSAAAIGALPRRNTPKWLAWAIAGAVLVAIGIAVYATRERPSSSEPPVTTHLMRLTDFVGMEEFPALSPDGKSVAFTADAGGRRQVWVRLLAGGTPLQVTHEDADHQSPRWSSDSSSLIYFSPSEEPDGEGKIWQVPALGGAARPLISSLAGADLSHDGKHIAYLHSNQGELDLMVADPDGSNPRKVAALSGEYNYSD